MVLSVLLLSGGCDIEKKSPKDESAIDLFWSIGIIILSWPVVILLTLLGRRLNLVRNRMVLLQYGIFLLIQIFISLCLSVHIRDFNNSAGSSVLWIIFAIVIIQVLALPYLLLACGLLVLVLPVRLLAWLPSFLLVPYYLMFGLYYVTNEYVIVHPLFLWTNWEVSIHLFWVILVALLIRSEMGVDNIKRRYKTLINYFKKQDSS